MPMLAELGNAKPPNAIDGISVVPVLLGEGPAGRKQRQHECMYWEGNGLRAARAGRWKAVLKAKPRARLELYNLESDVREARNVAADYPSIAAKMKAYMDKAHARPRPQIEPPKPKGRQYQ